MGVAVKPVAIPPGMTIREMLEDRGMSQKEFAQRMGLSEKHVSKLINGEVQLTPKVAMHLEFVLGAPAHFWNNLESLYREDLIRLEEESDMADDLEYSKRFPFSRMVDLGWLPGSQNPVERVRTLRRFFEVCRFCYLERESLNRIACRRVDRDGKPDYGILAWAQKAKLEARGIETGPLDVEKLVEYVPKVRAMMVNDPEECMETLASDFAEMGIALVLLHGLWGSSLQGASFMDGKRIVVVLTPPGNNVQGFWFNLLHEVAHVVLGHVQRGEPTSEEDETAADSFARDALLDLLSPKDL